eukprot:3157046-Alexandrium_andersonii.AAC.1
MSASLVGSEMCIRDSCMIEKERDQYFKAALAPRSLFSGSTVAGAVGDAPCLLYTSDAADDM